MAIENRMLDEEPTKVQESIAIVLPPETKQTENVILMSPDAAFTLAINMLMQIKLNGQA